MFLHKNGYTDSSFKNHLGSWAGQSRLPRGLGIQLFPKNPQHDQSNHKFIHESVNILSLPALGSGVLCVVSCLSSAQTQMCCMELIHSFKYTTHCFPSKRDQLSMTIKQPSNIVPYISSQPSPWDGINQTLTLIPLYNIHACITPQKEGKTRNWGLKWVPHQHHLFSPPGLICRNRHGAKPSSYFCERWALCRIRGPTLFH
jgi:hypothetical protein